MCLHELTFLLVVLDLIYVLSKLPHVYRSLLLYVLLNLIKVTLQKIKSFQEYLPLIFTVLNLYLQDYIQSICFSLK